MAAAAHEAPAGDDLQRPYTLGTFQSKLNRFQDLIREITYQDYEATPEERRQWITENLRYDQFCEKIRDLFGSDIKNQDLKSVYRKISTNPDAKVDWSELFGYFQSGVEEEELTVGEEVSIFMVSKRRRVGEAAGDRKRRDSVQHIKYISALDSYIASSQKGAISVWTSKLRLQACVDINEPAWVTGCDYLPGLRRVACCTERSIAIWDNRAKGKSQHIFIIKPIEHSPQCMTYVPSQSLHEDLVLFGDDQGYVNVLTIGSKDLNMKNSKGEKRNSQNVIIEPSKLSTPIVRRKIHGDWVLKVKYFPELRCFASCSPSSHQSFVLEETERLYDNGEVRGVSIPKGVNCFDYCARANILATGGVDKVIRVWHPHIFSRPTGKLMGHLFTIIDIACNERDQHIISLSTARVFRVWDIHTLTCLQVFTDNEERPGEKRIYSMLFDNKHERLLTGSSVIDAWPLTRAVQDTMQVPHTHDRPVVQIMINKELNQIVSVCTESVIKVWEMDSGKLVYTIPEAHGANIEVTAITLDKSGYRLVSGAFDGSLKVWDFGAGQVIKWKAGRGTDEDLSITGLLYQRFHHDDHIIVASGWTNKIRLFVDSNDNNDLTLLREFSDVYYWTREVSLTPEGTPIARISPAPLPPVGSNGLPGSPALLPDIGQANAQATSIFRKDYLLTSHEVTCMTLIDTDVMATGCRNGNIIFWHIEKSAVDRIFTLPAPEVASAKSRRMRQVNERRVHSVHVLVHKIRRLDPAYIKKLTGMYRSETAEGEREEEANQHDTLQSRRSKRSVISVGQGEDGQLDDESRRMLDELATKVEGNPKDSRGGAGHGDEGNVTARDGNAVAPDEGDGTHRSGAVTTARSGDLNTDRTGEDTAKEEGGEEKEEDQAYEGEGEEERGARQTSVDPADPDAKMIVDTFDPILVSLHQDSFVRFWDLETGDILREVSPLTRRQGVPVTALCHDADVNFLVTGDNKGYLTLWDCKAFMEDPLSADPDALKQVLCWRAHLTKVVSLQYVDSLKAILSASTDGSVRVWWGQKGRFVGFFGQHRPFNFPANEEMAGTPVLPYDITEGPLAPIKRKSATQKIRSVQKFEYPLIFDKQRWEPFRRSAYLARRHEILKPEDKKFFQALIKPKAYNTHLESFTTGEKKSGAVFRALPVYRVRTPKRPKTPEMSYRLEDDEEEGMYSSNIFGVAQANKLSRMRTKASDKPRPSVPLSRFKAVCIALQGAKAFAKGVDKQRTVFFRPGVLSQLEAGRDEKLTGIVTQFQALCRGYLGRKKTEKLRVQHLAVRCIQRNVRKYMLIREWTWWKLYTKVKPILNVHRTEEELLEAQAELEAMKTKTEKLEKERNEYKAACEKLETRLAEMTADLMEENTTSTQASEMLEAESAERMRLEKELKELQAKYSPLKRQNEKLQMEVMQSRVWQAQSMEEEMEDEVDGGTSIYKERCQKLLRELQMTKKQMQQQHEEDLEQELSSRKMVEKRLHEAVEEAEEQRRQVQVAKKKTQRLTAEMQDIKRLLEEQMARNNELERKQRRFDSELGMAHEDVKEEKQLREKLQRERDQLLSEKYSLEQSIQNLRMDQQSVVEKAERLDKELNDILVSGKDNSEVVSLKRAKHELELKLREQEEELDDQAGQIQQLEQTKLRLEMNMEKMKKQHQSEIEEKEEELEDMRTKTQKKLRSMESQLEEEYDEKRRVMEEKGNLERQLQEYSARAPARDRESEKRLRRNLKKTKALLADAGTMLAKQKNMEGAKQQIAQLRNQLDEAEFRGSAAVKAKKRMELEIQDLHQQIEDMSRAKQEVESKNMALLREKADLQSNVEDNEEEMSELMKKYKAAVQQQSVHQITMTDQLQQIEELIKERDQLRLQVSDLSTRVQGYEEGSVDKHSMTRLETKLRDVESRVELEQSQRQRFEGQVGRMKDQMEKVSSEKEDMAASRMAAEEVSKRAQKQLRELREELADAQKKEIEACQKYKERENEVETMEVELAQSRADLKLAFKRITDLQAALEDELDSDDSLQLDDSDLDSEDDDDEDLDSYLGSQHGTSLRTSSTFSSPRSERYSTPTGENGLMDA